MMLLAAPNLFHLVQKFDDAARESLLLTFHEATFRVPMSQLAKPYAIVAFAPVVLIWIIREGSRARRIFIAMVLLLALTSGLTSLVLKAIIARPSPLSNGYSFPDFATANAFLLATFISLFYVSRAWWTMIVALAIGMSCAVAGDAWPTDVLAGAALGIAIAIAAWNATHNFLNQRPFDYSGGNLDPAQSRRMSRR